MTKPQYLVTILTLLIALATTQSQFVSPCPRLFRYLPRNPNEQDRWYGEVLVQSDVELVDGVFIVLVFDKPSIQLGSSFGQQILRKSETEYTLRNLGYKLAANTPLLVKFYIRYNQYDDAPRLTGFRVNARPVCPERGISNDQFVTSKPALVYNNNPPAQDEELNYDLRDHPDPSPYNNHHETKPTNQNRNQENKGGADSQPEGHFRGEENVQCGTVPAKPVGLIVNGQESAPGEWPWHVALMKFEGAASNYICGGTLITKRHVLTAAHCVTGRPSNSKLNTESLTVFLGKNNLRYTATTDQQRDVSEIYVHPDFSQTGLKNDVAVLKLSSPATLNDYVRPVCLWSGSTNQNEVVNRKGSVVGWGYDEHKRISTTLRKVDIPVIERSECIYSNPKFFPSVLWEKNFCAGYKNGTMICNGDSGGGMFFAKPGTRGAQTVWRIRGLVSIGVGNQGYRSVCDSQEYTVFTDVAQYQDWIERTLEK
ncbi:unnamed protein product [Brassicogethes aeneus]|uniref:Peptidase S1 domain-containing protein n=1 Tax=Brassicogethes aeneus TaxID=1431903 RepID=A0A9P0AT64_BRAAE|nr:unnamed protein product [Brassicogethes aeneus]